MLNTIGQRLISALILTPGIMLVLVWIGRIAGPDEIAGMGIAQFLLWAAGVGFGVAATITLYIAYLTKADRKQ